MIRKESSRIESLFLENLNDKIKDMDLKFTTVKNSFELKMKELDVMYKNSIYDRIAVHSDFEAKTFRPQDHSEPWKEVEQRLKSIETKFDLGNSKSSFDPEMLSKFKKLE